MSEISERMVNPGVIVTMALSGVAYGLIFLWALNIRDAVRLWMVAILPGLVFSLLLWAIRFAQGGGMPDIYVFLVIDWLVFANAAWLSVLVRRWFRGKP